ncbi:Protein of unknown function [Bacillus mycoides]|nr:Protein of unknown function [Bacillus mycoides]
MTSIISPKLEELNNQLKKETRKQFILFCMK